MTTAAGRANRRRGVTPHEQRVALGPITGTDWCVLDDPPEQLRAPGGVVLCVEGSLTPHPDAARAARSAWEILERWRDNEQAHRRIV